MNKYIKLDEMIDLQGGKVSTMKDVLSRFMIDPATNDYYPVESVETDDDIVITPSPVAKRLLGKVTMEKLSSLVGEFTEKVTNAAVSPTTAAT